MAPTISTGVYMDNSSADRAGFLGSRGSAADESAADANGGGKWDLKRANASGSASAVEFSHAEPDHQVRDAVGHDTSSEGKAVTRSATGSAPKSTTSEPADAERELWSQVLRAKREISYLEAEINRREERIEAVARQRKTRFEWTESPEERLQKQQLAHLRLRRRAVLNWLRAQEKAGVSRRSSTRRSAADGNRSATSAESKGSTLSSGSKKPMKSTKKSGSKRSQKRALAAKASRPQRAVRGVSSGSGRRRATLIG